MHEASLALGALGGTFALSARALALASALALARQSHVLRPLVGGRLSASCEYIQEAGVPRV